MIYIGNAFSLSMLDMQEPASVVRNVRVTLLTLDEVKNLLKHNRVVSCIGHQTTAVLFSSMLDHYLPVDRISVVLKGIDTMIVGQYSGPRLDEGVTTLPEGASIRWMMVSYTHHSED